MALRKPKDSNLSLLIQALASAYHRGPDGMPKYQPIALRTKGVISSATVHLWRHSGVRNVTGHKLKALADAYGLDFPTLMAFVYGPATRMEGDELLASLRHVRPIGGGSAHPATRGLDTGVGILDALSDAMSLIGRCWPHPWGSIQAATQSICQAIRQQMLLDRCGLRAA